MTHPTFEQLLAPERESLLAFRNRYGYRWRNRLYLAWLNGWEIEEEGGLWLRGLRNKHGLDWIFKVEVNTPETA